MTSTQLKQHLTVKNIFIAIVALNVLSAMTVGPSGGTFQHVSKAPVSTPREAPGAAVADPGMAAHLMPGEAQPPHAAMSERPAPPAWTKPAPQAKPAARSKPASSDPPGVNWIMLLSIGAMALYARYLAARMAQNAVEHAVGSVKQIFGALAGLSAGPRVPAKPVHAARQPSTPAPPKAKVAQQPRKSTVVRASRWPFAA